MPCTYTGSLEGDRAFFAQESLNRRERYLCAICRYIDERGDLNLSQVLQASARAAEGVATDEIEKWWTAHSAAEKD